MRLVPYNLSSILNAGLAVFFGFLIFVVPAQVMASSAPKEPVEEAPEFPPGEGPERDEDYTFVPSYVQLKVMMVPITKSNNKMTTIPVSVFLKIKKVKYMRNLCQKIPYVHEAIMQVVSEHPIRTKGVKLFDNEASPALAASINKTFGNKYVKGVAIFPGRVRRTEPMVVEREIISNTCQTVLRKKVDEENAIFAATKAEEEDE